MSLEQKNTVRPIYSELRGYLNESPSIGDHGNSTSSDETIWRQVNTTIEELNQITGKDFSKFKITGIKSGQNNSYIHISEYRTKLGGLITRLYGTYFYDEPAPFPGMPSTTINVSNQQSQHQTMILELTHTIDEKLKELPEGEHKSFLTELKKGMGTVSSFASLMILISELGQKYAMSLADIASLLKL